MPKVTKEQAMKINNGKAVMSGVPIYANNYFPQFAASYFNAHFNGKFYKHTSTNGDSLITRARNNITHRFLESDATHLLFLDSDLEFNNQSIDNLYRHDKSIVCGVYPKKELELNWVINQNEKIGKKEGSLLRVQAAGTGFMLIKREVFEDIMEADEGPTADNTDWYICDTNKDLRFDFFKVGCFRSFEGQEHNRYLSEDWYFCDKARELGHETWVDTDVTLSHHGHMKYPVTGNELESALERWNKLAKDSNGSNE